MANWEKLLHSLGFTDSEAKIYLISLESGPSAVQDLAKKARVSRVTTYAVIESLMGDGLMSTVQKGKKNLYVAESPERLLSFVHSRMKTMEATLREIEVSLGDLRLLQRGEKPVVKMFEGVEGLKALQDDILKVSPKHTDEFANIDTVSAIFTREDLQPFREELARMKISGRFLYAGNMAYSPRKGVEARHVHPDKSTFNGDIILYRNKTALSTFHGKLITIIIESQVIADTMRGMFELAWHSSFVEK
ncbi:MAG: helix-turn-helix domain-containing protein [Patescibacteria group bacterium]